MHLKHPLSFGGSDPKGLNLKVQRFKAFKGSTVNHLKTLKVLKVRMATLNFKILLIGDFGSGKRTFLNSVLKYPDLNILDLNTSYGIVRFHIFTEGQADGALLFFDLTKSQSAQTLKGWKLGFSLENPGAPIVICGSKCDSPMEDRMFSHTSILQLVQGYKFFYISSKTGFKTYEPLVALARSLTGKPDLYI